MFSERRSTCRQRSATQFAPRTARGRTSRGSGTGSCSAARMHVHEREDEYSYVLAGRLGVRIGDEVLEAGPGELVLKPRGIPHAFWNPGDEEARVLEIVSPAGFEQYFADLAPVLAAEGEPDFAALGAIQARYGLSMDMESIGPLTAEHGLD